MAAAVLLAWLADLLVRACEERIPWLTKHHVISGFRLFKLSMCTALALICAIRRTTPFVFKSEWFFRLSGLCLDLMAVGTSTYLTYYACATVSSNYTLVAVSLHIRKHRCASLQASMLVNAAVSQQQNSSRTCLYHYYCCYCHCYTYTQLQ
jgi:hypothetical protein